MTLPIADGETTGGRIVLVLGDQLSDQLSGLREGPRPETLVLMAEVAEEARYAPHHPQKIALIFSAMRHFAERLARRGFRVHYVRFDDPENSGSLKGEVARLAATGKFADLVLTEPGEWRVEQMFLQWRGLLPLRLDIRPDDRFLVARSAFAAWARDRKALRMEHFYRAERRRHGVLMQADGEPEGGRWNFDHDNRRRYDAKRPLPERVGFAPDAITRDVLDLVEKHFSQHFGTLEGFDWAVTQEQAEHALARFIAEALPGFGDYQDAMLDNQSLLFHSRLSAYLNIGLLNPLQVCRAVESAYREGHVPLNAAEGFIRQILGWREYIRGMYWTFMPQFAQANALMARRQLPAFYWGAVTPMRCVSAAVDQTRREAYAHHIQRLMVTGNFALLAGIEPKQVSEWYLAVYADAFEWVELPNTLGMALFADGGRLASKPYCASGAYINRMSNYCQSCQYDVRLRTGPSACPFNFLYWDFLDRNEATLKHNPRMTMSYRNLAAQPNLERSAIRAQARRFLDEHAPEAS